MLTLKFKKLQAILLSTALAIIMFCSVFLSIGMQKIPEEISSMSNVEITTTLSNKQLNASKKLTADFSFEGKVSKWHYETEGVDVVGKRASKGKISVDIKAKEGAGRLDLFADFGDGYQQEIVYTYGTSGMVFASAESEDAAFVSALDYEMKMILLHRRKLGKYGANIPAKIRQ